MENGDHAHLLNVIDEVEKLRDGRHKNANAIVGLSGRLAVAETTLKTHDRVIWAGMFGVITLLAGVAAFYISKYGVVP
jgi:hypothetical protein